MELPVSRQSNKFGHIWRGNEMLGIQVPTLVTPYELMMDKTDPIERGGEARLKISHEHPDTRSLLAHY